MKLTPHPPCSLDRVPSDYYLFSSICDFLRGRQFKTFENVRLESKHLSIQNKRYLKRLDELTKRWLKTKITVV